MESNNHVVNLTNLLKISFTYYTCIHTRTIHTRTRRSVYFALFFLAFLALLLFLPIEIKTENNKENTQQ